MKNNLVLLLLTATLFVGCKTLRSTETPEQLANRIKAKVESLDFTFEPVTAQTLRFGTVRLQNDFTLRLNKDTLRVCLPYYGQAYSVPLNTMNGGFNFTSTKFERNLITSDGAGSWRLNFNILDLNTRINMFMEIWSNGGDRLTVNDPEKQSITYEGSIDN
jgi:hypothetical protein